MCSTINTQSKQVKDVVIFFQESVYNLSEKNKVRKNATYLTVAGDIATSVRSKVRKNATYLTVAGDIATSVRSLPDPRTASEKTRDEINVQS